MNTFKKARIKLTVWYILISVFLLTVFSLAAVTAEQRAFNRIEQVLSNKATRPRLTALLDERISQFDKDFKRRLLFFDLVLFVIASGAGYFLSGVTLKPIQEMVKKQEEFSADASHALRTPLSTIHLEIEALKRTKKNIPLSCKKVLDSINDEVLLMKGIVDGLLQLVRGGKLEDKSHWKIFSLSMVAKDSLEQISPLAKNKYIKLTSNIEDAIRVFGSEGEVKEAIVILLDNAIKYTPEKGHVDLKAYKNNKSAILTVSDTGIGISEKDMPHIFERFYRGTNSQLLSQKGTGLGLHIAQSIIKNHKGKISVKSIPEKGSVFTIELSFLLT